MSDRDGLPPEAEPFLGRDSRSRDRYEGGGGGSSRDNCFGAGLDRVRKSLTSPGIFFFGSGTWNTNADVPTGGTIAGTAHDGDGDDIDSKYHPKRRASLTTISFLL